MVLIRQAQSILLSCALALSAFAQDASQTAPAASSAASPAQLHQLVAPIALYPDALVGQILAASTYPTQVVEAQRWLQQNSGLKGDALVSAVNQQPWDPSIKALTQFPSVLNNMSRNLSWTSSLGDAYYNNSKDVMDAIQALRRQAQEAGNLKSTSQQTVETQNQVITIQPANPDVVYVPTYSPSVVYGAPIEAYPGYSGWDVAAASALSFGVGTAVGAAIGGGWGWNSWGTNWHGGNVTYNHNTFVSNSNTFANRNANFNQFNRANVNSNLANRNVTNQAFQGNRNQFNNPNRQLNKPANSQLNRQPNFQNFNAGDRAQQFNREHQNFAGSRGFGEGDRSSIGSRSGAFGGFSQGGSARLDSARGHSSFGGGGGFRGGGFGGGGFHGGGFRGGGFRGGGRR